ncbi:MAG: porin OmpA [Aeromonas sp.]
MKKSMFAVLVSGVLASGIVHAAAQDNTWYVGSKAGWSNYYGVDKNSLISESFAAVGNNRESSDGLGLGLFTGYQLNSNVGVELGYDWLGKYKIRGGNGVTDLYGEAKSQLIQATMKIGLPVSAGLDLYSRLGGGYGWTDSKISVDGESGTGHKRGAVFVGALGAEYVMHRDWAARVEYQYTTPLGDTSLDRTGIELDNGLLSVGMLYRYGQQGEALAAPIAAPVVVETMAPMEAKTFSLSSDVLFEFNKATLKPGADQALDTLFSQIVAANPTDGIATVIGYTDRIGSDNYNLALSERRAQSVASYLVSKGLYADKVRVEGRGKANSITGSGCASHIKQELIACLAPDRRVEIHLEGVSQPVQ